MSVELRGKIYTVKEKKGLLTLNLSQKRINDIEEIRGLETLSDLQVLNLRYNFIKEIKGLEKLKNLKILDLSQNRVNKISGLDTLSNLEELNLRNNDISIIEGLNNLNSLKKLDLWSNNINQIKSLNIMEQLSNIIINGNPIYDYLKNQPGASILEKFQTFYEKSEGEKQEIIEIANQDKKNTITIRNTNSYCGIILIIFSVVILFFLLFSVGPYLRTGFGDNSEIWPLVIIGFAIPVICILIGLYMFEKS